MIWLSGIGSFPDGHSAVFLPGWPRSPDTGDLKLNVQKTLHGAFLPQRQFIGLGFKQHLYSLI